MRIKFSLFSSIDHGAYERMGAIDLPPKRLLEKNAFLFGLFCRWALLRARRRAASPRRGARLTPLHTHHATLAIQKRHALCALTNESPTRDCARAEYNNAAAASLWVILLTKVARSCLTLPAKTRGFAVRRRPPYVRRRSRAREVRRGRPASSDPQVRLGLLVCRGQWGRRGLRDPLARPDPRVRPACRVPRAPQVRRGRPVRRPLRWPFAPTASQHRQ